VVKLVTIVYNLVVYFNPRLWYNVSMMKQETKMKNETKDIILACITGAVIGVVWGLTYVLRTGGF
jgi:hypothetical protein